MGTNRDKYTTGDRCYVARYREQETVGDLGSLSHLAVYDSRTDEPLQRIGIKSDVEHLVKQWDEVLAPRIPEPSGNFIAEQMRKSLYGSSS
jgi:hypothetical protein